MSLFAPSFISKSSTVASLRLSTPLASSFISRPFQRQTFAATRSFSSSRTNNFRPTPATMVVQEIKSTAEFQQKLASGKPFVLDCYADWCGPCKAIAPKIDAFSEEHTHADFYKINVDDLAELSADLGVRAMPSFFFYKDGKKVADVVGANPKAVEDAVKALA